MPLSKENIKDVDNARQGNRNSMFQNGEQKMNLLTKHKPWMIASLFAATSLFGQNQSYGSQKQGTQASVCKPAKCGMTQAAVEPTVAAYNAPAEINIGMQGEIDFFVTGSFIYWQPLQDNTSTALVLNESVGSGANLSTGTTAGNYLEMDFKYKPGFKVALGMNVQDDNWVGYAEYTRVHGTHNTSSTGAATGSSIVSPMGYSPDQIYDSVSAEFTCNLDFVDAMLERVYYVGRNLVVHSAMGARGAWIKESLIANYAGGHSSIVTPTTPAATVAFGSNNSVQRVHSWAVGPRFGTELDWDLGEGVRFFGNTFVDLLYTKYKVQQKLDFVADVTVADVTETVNPSFPTRDRVRALRAHLDTELGFGWGMYFDDNAWHVDLSAAYGFQVFFNQNMFTTYGTQFQYNGNLYVHGLTTTARFDF